MKHVFVASAGLAALVAPSRIASAQGVLYAWPVDGYTTNSVAAAGDVDADGFGDFLYGVPGPLGPGVLGRIEVHSGRTGGALHVISSPNPQDRFGASVAGLGDVDHDGHADFAASAWEPAAGGVPAYTIAFSGATGAVIWRVDAANDLRETGYSLARIADVDGDGADDLIVGSVGVVATVVGRVHVRSGSSGALILDLVAPTATAGFGVAVATAGDLDQDGTEDVLVGDSGTNGGPGLVTVHSGRTGAILRAILDPGPTADGFASSAATLGDVNGDGLPDYAVGSPSEVIVPNARSGRVRVFSGSDASLLLQIEPDASLVQFGEGLCRAPDLDGDGRADVMLGAGDYRTGCCGHTQAEARVYSSATGALLQSGRSQSSRRLATVPDANGDGLEDYLTALADSYSGPAIGLALSRTAGWTPQPNCVAKVNSLGCRPSIYTGGAPSLTAGDDLVFSARRVVPNALGMFVWSRGAAQTPFGGGTLCLAAPIHRWRPLITSAGQLDNSCGPTALLGTMTRTITKPELAATGMAPGTTFHVQGWFRDAGFAAPNDIGLTDALVLELWP